MHICLLPCHVQSLSFRFSSSSSFFLHFNDEKFLIYIFQKVKLDYCLSLDTDAVYERPFQRHQCHLFLLHVSLKWEWNWIEFRMLWLHRMKTANWLSSQHRLMTELFDYIDFNVNNLSNRFVENAAISAFPFNLRFDFSQFIISTHENHQNDIFEEEGEVLRCKKLPKRWR